MKTESLLYNFLSYLRHPTYFVQGNTKSLSKRLFDIARLFALLYLIIIVLGILSSVAILASGYNVQDNSVVSQVETGSILATLLLAVVIAPITEETTFRLILRFSYKKLAIGITFIAIIMIQLLKDFVFVNRLPDWLLNIRNFLGGASYLVFLIIFTLLIYFLAKKFINKTRAENFYLKHIGKLFYLSIICFGLIHIANYVNLGNLIWIAPLFILPQLAAGTFLAYIRMNYSFKFGILTHSFYNLFTLSPILILSLGSNNIQSLLNGTHFFSTLANLTQADLTLITLIGVIVILVLLIFLAFNLQLLIEYFNFKKAQNFPK